jgi:hypothetical protein
METIRMPTDFSSLPQREMKLLLSTRFSESCFNAIPAVAQWMDDVASSLTIVHVYNPKKTHYSEAEAQLNAFFAEADRYGGTRRVLLSGEDPAKAMAAYLEQEAHDLLVCPATDQVGFPRPFHRSTRARLMQLTSTPLWTISASAEGLRARPPQRVGCVISRRSDSRRPLELAAQYAQFHGACLQLMYLVPEVDDGTIRNSLSYNEPLSERTAARELGKLVDALSLTCEIYTARGVCSRSLADMVSRARTDLLFIGKNEVLRRKLWLPDVASFTDSAGCPVVCVDHDRSTPLNRLFSARVSERAVVRRAANTVSSESSMF